MTAHRIGSGRPLPEQRITPPETEGCQHCRGKGCPGCVEGWDEESLGIDACEPDEDVPGDEGAEVVWEVER